MNSLPRIKGDVLWVAAVYAVWLGAASTTPTSAQAEIGRMDQTLVARAAERSLFNGNDFTGWTIRGGKATFKVEDGVIVGTCAARQGGNTFLCTDNEYSDFVLDLEVKPDPGLNSGVQVRSQCFDSPTEYLFGDRKIRIPAGRVHGYQVEVDHRSERRWSGGIYDEARRGWLYQPTKNPATAEAFKVGEWNHYRIVCVGPSFRTWVNDVPVADLLDAETLRGFVGLQVHSADNPDFQVRFRNVRIQELGAHRWTVAWDCRSLDPMEQSGAGNWSLDEGVLVGTQARAQVGRARLAGTVPMKDFTARFKYKLESGQFDLAFLAGETPSPVAALHASFGASVGETNIARSDWNVVTIIAQGDRMVINLNGHQIKNVSDEALRSGVRPALELPAAAVAEARFKDFEILERLP